MYVDRVSEKTRNVKHEVTIFSDIDQWEQTIQDAVFCMLERDFAPEKEHYIRKNEKNVKFNLPKDIHVTSIGLGSYSRFTMPTTKFVKALDTDKNFENLQLRGIKKYTTDYKDGESEVLIPTREYFLSNNEFQKHAYKALEKVKDKPNLWAIVSTRVINPHLDYIDVGLGIGHD
jgi:hypothetical protein